MTTKKWSMSTVFHLGWINVKVLSWLRLAGTALNSDYSIVWLSKWLVNIGVTTLFQFIISEKEGDTVLHCINWCNLRCGGKFWATNSWYSDAVLLMWYHWYHLHCKHRSRDKGKQLYKIKSSEIELVKQLRVHRPPK